MRRGRARRPVSSRSACAWSNEYRMFMVGDDGVRRATSASHRAGGQRGARFDLKMQRTAPLRIVDRLKPPDPPTPPVRRPVTAEALAAIYGGFTCSTRA